MPRQPSYDTAAMELEFASCSSRLQELQQHSRKLARCLKAAQKTENQRTKRAMDVAFILYVETAPAHDLDVEYLRRRWDDTLNLDWSRVAEELETRFIEADPDDISAILDGKSPLLPLSLFKEAARFKGEAAIHKWVRNQNVSQGIAPSPQLVMMYRRDSNFDMTADLGKAGTQLPFTAGEKKWLRRFRTRWQISLAKVPVGEVVPLPELREKAFRGSKKVARNLALCRFAISDPTQNRDRIMVPILGTTRVHERNTWDHNAVLLFGHFFIQAAAFGSGAGCLVRPSPKARPPSSWTLTRPTSGSLTRRNEACDFPAEKCKVLVSGVAGTRAKASNGRVGRTSVWCATAPQFNDIVRILRLSLKRFVHNEFATVSHQRFLLT